MQGTDVDSSNPVGTAAEINKIMGNFPMARL